MDFNLMYSSSHINMGTSNDDLFDKGGKNQNSLHYKYNNFLVSRYLPRGYNYSLSHSQPKINEYNNDNKENELDDSLGETHMYYPKPNNYNSIYTQRYSKKYKNFYNNNSMNPYYARSPTESYNNKNGEYMNRDKPIRILQQEQILNTVKTPDYQIKNEIQFQKTPDNYKNDHPENNNEEWVSNNKYNNYKRYDDYNSPSNKVDERYNSPVISKIAENNFINPEFSVKNHYLTPGGQDKRRRIYFSDNIA